MYGNLTNMNNAIRRDENVSKGSAYIGDNENIEIDTQYIIFLKYLIRIKKTPNLFVFYMPR